MVLAAVAIGFIGETFPYPLPRNLWEETIMSVFIVRLLGIDFFNFWGIFSAPGPLCALLAAAATRWFWQLQQLVPLEKPLCTRLGGNYYVCFYCSAIRH